MWIVLKTEIKNSYSGSLEYVQDDVIGVADSLDEAKEILKTNVARTLDIGYFNKEIFIGETIVQLTNGGTAYLRYRIHKV